MEDYRVTKCHFRFHLFQCKKSCKTKLSDSNCYVEMLQYLHLSDFSVEIKSYSNFMNR